MDTTWTGHPQFTAEDELVVQHVACVLGKERLITALDCNFLHP